MPRHGPSRASCGGVLPLIACLALMPQPCLSDTASDSSNGNKNLSASAQLDFQINIGKFIFFRVGDGAFPTASATVNTVRIEVAPSIPPNSTAPVEGDRQGVAWDGSAPTFTTLISDNVLPVEVRSNAGPIEIRAMVTAPLTNGVDTIPMSQLVVTSDDANLLAPVIPDSGTGEGVSVTGTGFGNLVTVREAQWTFGIAEGFAPPPGSYTGRITFTASSL